MSEDAPKTAQIADLTATIVSNYVQMNKIAASELSALIQSVAATLKDVSSGAVQAPKEELKPAVPIRRSVSPDAITCLECGKQFRSIKRHLSGEHAMTPEDYRAKWGLAKDYPTVAPNYAAQRSELAKRMGLGQGGRGKAPAKPARGRGKAAK